MTSLTAATERLLTTARSLTDDDWAAPSLCAGWSRAHVLAHLALNAEGLAGVLRGIRDGRPTTMYASDGARDGDIDVLAAEPPAVVIERLVAGSAALADVAGVSAGLAPGTTFERTPGGQLMPADGVPALRLREVEIHHADLDAGYSASDWPPATAIAFVGNDAARYDGPGFHVVATDEPARWAFGSPAANAPTVSGPLGALAWWATGREPAAVLSSTTGTLPSLEGR
ncbi:maleylpyruvate isomerase family mycothiol-dependent enzyme [Nocardioides carbamazepini]|uniref:maleylpyruvate isomerase family mycothiol-dependent enzyme n=1 Tax=Nocardioides carbamazepini TaxID=2854259 RepID=UPI00214A4F0C|nr:maleylpyruvate isomerase family mycothiol-dependent enzyme [Nocardioides carbamazepini]MCR1782955.1 maleylpyruvate isomerase family mycothiol-dependent enzyme [Nocardioides carbamazepini]